MIFVEKLITFQFTRALDIYTDQAVGLSAYSETVCKILPGL